MAAVDLAAITGVLGALFDDAITNTINRSIPGAQLLPCLPAPGKNLQWAVRTGTAAPSTAPIAEGVNVSTFNSDTKRSAILTFTTYHDAFSVSGLALSSAANSGNPAELANLFAEELGESAQRLAAVLGSHMYIGSGASDQILGLVATDGGIMDTGTYATIDRGTVTQWRGTVMANGGVPRALTLDLMREMRRRIYIACGEKPDLILCDPIQHEAYGKLFKEQRRYVQEVTLRGQTIKLDGGYQVLEFDGIPVVEDVNCPAGKMLFLNTRHAFWRFLPQPSDAVTQAKGEMNLAGTPEEQFGGGSMKLKARLQPLAINGDKYNFALYIYPQMQVKNPNRHGVITDLA